MSESADSSAIMLAIICFVFYFAPTFNAASRKHPKRASVFIVNLFLGWTLIGWVVALVWSVSPIKKETVSPDLSAGAGGKYSELERLGALKEKGLITDDEFEAEKLKLLG